MKQIRIPWEHDGERTVEFALVDDQFFDEINKFRWHITKVGNVKYATTWGKNPRTTYMHRMVMTKRYDRVLRRTEEVDHIDHDGLNNQLSNLRLATRSQNQSNQSRHKDSKSDFVGVHYNKRFTKPYRGKLMFDGKNIHLPKGYDTPEEAARERDILAVKYFGNNSVLNFPDNIKEYQGLLAKGYDPEAVVRAYTSKLPGITYREKDKRYIARIFPKGQVIYVGCFRTEEEAVEAQKLKAKEIGLDYNLTKSRIKGRT
jgi:hypothetical protein